MIVVYTIYLGSPEPVRYLLVDDMKPRCIEGPIWKAEQALLMRYSDVRYLEQREFEDVIFTRQMHENARLTTLRRLQKEKAS